MPTLTNIDDSKAAKKAAARAGLAHARQWRDERRGTASPAAKPTIPSSTNAIGTKSRSTQTSTKPATADGFGETKKTSNEPAPPSGAATGPNTRSTRRSTTNVPASANVPATAAKSPNASQARANARKWSTQQKKEKGLSDDARFKAVPDLVETEVAENVEALSVCAVDFKTADSAKVMTAKDWKRNVTLIKNDTKNAFNRIQLIASENSELAFIRNDIRNICDRMQHLCESDTDADESRAMDLD